MDKKSNDIVWQKMKVNKVDYEQLNGHKSCVLWFTGLSGSGKSTIATELSKVLMARKVHSIVLDGDNLRHGLTKDLGFSQKDRRENIRRIGEVAKLFQQAGFIVMTATISPYLDLRMMIRNLFEEGEFIEIYVKCSIEECVRRDPKGLYKKAKAGQISNFTGISDAYEEPVIPELTIETDKRSIQDSVEQIIGYLESLGFLGQVDSEK